MKVSIYTKAINARITETEAKLSSAQAELKFLHGLLAEFEARKRRRNTKPQPEVKP